MKNTTFSLSNLFSHSPAWASVSLSIWGTAYGVYLLGITNDMYHLSPHAEHMVNGIYGMGNLILLAFGAKRKDDNHFCDEENRYRVGK